MNQKIKIFIVDDHQIFIDGLSHLLLSYPDIDIIGTANDAITATSLISKLTLDILITDIGLGEVSGIELTKRIKKMNPDLKVLILSMHADTEIIRQAILAEADGYLLKDVQKDGLIEALRELALGGTYFSKKVLGVMMSQFKSENTHNKITLTERELEIVQWIAAELTTAEIAQKLFISERTVDSHRKNIMQKTNSKSVVGIIKYAYLNGLIVSHP